jgi:hypothetical protein
MVFDAASHVSSTLERTDFGRAHEPVTACHFIRPSGLIAAT